MHKYLASLLFIFLFASVSAAQNAEDTFQKFKLKGIGTIMIPPSMELQGGDGREMPKSVAKVGKSGIEVSGDQMIFQQKGSNELAFARVMIDTVYDPSRSYGKPSEKIIRTPDELGLLDRSLKSTLERSFTGFGIRLIDWYGTSIVTVNGQYALKTAYLRQLNNNPSVRVELYQFPNRDRMHKLTISYRQQDSSVWKNALERTVNSFTITKMR